MGCPHCKLAFVGHACVSVPGELPEEGDVGVCRHCGGWWTLQFGEFIKYMPSKDEEDFVIPKLPEIRP